MKLALAWKPVPSILYSNGATPPNPTAVNVKPEATVHWLSAIAGTVTVGTLSFTIVIGLLTIQPLASFTYTSQSKSAPKLVSTLTRLLVWYVPAAGAAAPAFTAA